MDSMIVLDFLSNSEKTIDYINKQLINYPKNEVILKQNIEKTMYLIIENIFFLPNRGY